MSEQAVAKVTGAHLARTAYLYLLTELPQAAAQLGRRVRPRRWARRWRPGIGRRR